MATKKKADSDVFDLDKLAAARREKAGKGPKLKWRGKVYQLPPEIPFEVALAARNALQGDKEEQDARGTAELATIAEALFGDRFGEFLATKPSVMDAWDLFISIPQIYQTTVSVGESQASES